MPRPAKIRTRLAYARLAAGLTQQEIAKMTGISIASYGRLERGLIHNPPLGWLANVAIVLNHNLEDFIEDEMREWQPLNGIKGAPSIEWRDRPEVRERAERFRIDQEQEG
ncbi:MAG TPA: helix-turn-helix transcriptional regulator [Gaiellaceae bacterium]|nr:helix-turn-helix transcriptional regulator [Gaiellaceae bacterium]